jgi:hypothetical protein
MEDRLTREQIGRLGAAALMSMGPKELMDLACHWRAEYEFALEFGQKGTAARIGGRLCRLEKLIEDRFGGER